MPQSKAAPKERYTRQRRNRELRRALASITPSHSHPQTQSPLFSLLPAELRLLIFTHVLSQRHDHTRPISIDSTSPLFRPGHTHHTTISTALLQTCRLVYASASSIPLRSTTHHFGYLSSKLPSYRRELWLRHVTKQQGLDLYHLHDTLVVLDASDFTKFMLPHLRWKRISWTVSAYFWPNLLQSRSEIEPLGETLQKIVLPESCREVTLELEARKNSLVHWVGLVEQADVCRRLALSRADGEKLVFDDGLARRHTWIGSGQSRWRSYGDRGKVERMEYQTIRLVWRAAGARREYVSYDGLGCLELGGCKEVRSIERLDWDVLKTSVQETIARSFR